MHSLVLGNRICLFRKLLYGLINSNPHHLFQWSPHYIVILKNWFCTMMVKHSFQKPFGRLFTDLSLPHVHSRSFLKTAPFPHSKSRLPLQSSSCRCHYQKICVCCAVHWGIVEWFHMCCGYVLHKQSGFLEKYDKLSQTQKSCEKLLRWLIFYIKCKLEAFQAQIWSVQCFILVYSIKSL